MNRRVALFTGASRGIGRTIAKRLGEDGFFVVVNYRSNRKAADEALAEVSAAGGEGVTVHVRRQNLSDRRRCCDLRETLVHLG